MIAKNFRKYAEAMALQLPLPFGWRLVWHTARPGSRIARRIRAARGAAAKAIGRIVYPTKAKRAPVRQDTRIMVQRSVFELIAAKSCFYSLTNTLIERILTDMDSASLTTAPRVQGLESEMGNATYYVMARLGSEATADDAEQVLELAEQLAAEQGDGDFDAIKWLNSRTYEWTDLWEAANGDGSAMARVRAEAGLPALSEQTEANAVIFEGRTIDLTAARQLMDDELCEAIHSTVNSEQEFLDAYLKAHEAKYSTPFVFN